LILNSFFAPAAPARSLSTVGGFITGIIANVIVAIASGRGVIDVLESVIRSSGFIKPTAAIEKIITSAVTIGTGGSGGAERADRADRRGDRFGGWTILSHRAPTNAADHRLRGGRWDHAILTRHGRIAVYAEVILLDFSSPRGDAVIIAVGGRECDDAGDLPQDRRAQWNGRAKRWRSSASPRCSFFFTWVQIPNFVLLGLICGVVAVSLTKLMQYSEHFFDHLTLPRFAKPAVGGALLAEWESRTS